MKIIRSVRDTRGNVIQKQPKAGAGQQRCPKCSGMCTAQRSADGKLVMKCGSCGASYISRGLDAARKARPAASPTRLQRGSARRP
jgi:hypothetical protein